MKWKIVPTVATAEMLKATFGITGATRGIQDQRCHAAMVAAAPPYVVTLADVERAVDAYVGSPSLDLRANIRAALESFVRRLGGGE